MSSTYIETPITERDRHPSAPPPPLREREPDYKRLLFMSDYPPANNGGAAIIIKQLLRQYDMSRLDVLCAREWYENQTPAVTDSFLPCRHTTVRNYRVFKPRPRRIFGPVMDSISCLRLFEVKKTARRIVRERGIEAIFTAPYHIEFMLGAYQLHRELGLPLYVFETDDWESANPHLLPRYFTRKFHGPLLRSATKLWVTSPAMQRNYRERFGVESDFLFHVVDV